MKKIYLFIALITFIFQFAKAQNSNEKAYPQIRRYIKEGSWHLLKPIFANAASYDAFIQNLNDACYGAGENDISKRLSIPAYFDYDEGNIIYLKSSGKKISLSVTFNNNRIDQILVLSEAPPARLKNARLSGSASINTVPSLFALLNKTENGKITYFGDYRSYFNQGRQITDLSGNSLPFRQIDFDPLNLKFKYCKKVLFVNFCEEQTKTINFGLVLSDKDDPANTNPNDYKNHYFTSISDMTAFSAPIGAGNLSTTDKDYALTAVIADNSAGSIAFFREGQLPLYFGKKQEEGAFSEPIAVKYIGHYLYVLDGTETNPVIHVLDPVYNLNASTHQGGYTIHYIGKIDKSLFNNDTYSFRMLKDIGGFEKSGNNVLVMIGAGGLMKIDIDKTTGMPVAGSGLKRFSEARNLAGRPDINFSKSFGYGLRVDCSNESGSNPGNTIAIGSDGQVFSFSNAEYDNNTITYDYFYKFDPSVKPSNIAYMFSEKVWHISDYGGKILRFSQEGRYIGGGGKFGIAEGNNELYFPAAITPNPIEDPSNDFRYRYMVATDWWGYETGIKLFAPYITIPEINVFESFQDQALTFTFITSNSWEVVEKATGVSMQKVLINDAEISAGLWNTQIPSTDDLTSYPNVFTIDPASLTLRRGWNKVEIRLQLTYSDKDPETITNTTTFYWLPSEFTPAAGDYQLNNDGRDTLFIYKPIKVNNNGLVYADGNTTLLVSQEGNLNMAAGSTFFNNLGFSNVKFTSINGGKVTIEDNAYLCADGFATTIIKNQLNKNLVIEPGYKSGKNAILTTLTGLCRSPCQVFAPGQVPLVTFAGKVTGNKPLNRFDVNVNTSLSYCNIYKWDVIKLDSQGQETPTSISQTFTDVTVTGINLTTLLSGFSFEFGYDYKVTLITGCNGEGGNDDINWFTANGCTKILSIKTEVKAGDDGLVCENGNPLTFTGFSPVPTVNGFNVSNTTATGYWSGANISHGGVLSIDGSLARNTSISYTYTYTDEFGLTNSAIKLITITSAPAAPVVSSNGPICDKGDLILSITGVSQADTYYWSGPEGLSMPTADPVLYLNALSIEKAGVYSVSGSSQNCKSMPATTTITILSLPGIHAGADETACIDAPVFSITGFGPEGGSWDGTGIVNSTPGFDPSVAGFGVHTVNYSFMNAAGCGNKVSKTITIGPLIDAGASQTACKNGSLVLLTVVSPPGGYFTQGETTLTGNLFDPAIAGTHLVTYHYTDGNNCSNMAVKTVTVIDLPVAPGIANNGPVCLNQKITLSVTGVTALPGVSYRWTGPNGFVSLNENPVIYSATLTMTGEYRLSIQQYGCEDSASFSTTTVTVNTLPALDAGSYTPICFGNALSLTGTPANGTWSGPNLAGNVFTPQSYGTKTFTYAYTDQNGCTNSTTTSVIVNPQNTVTILGLLHNNICRPGLLNPAYLVADPTGGANDINPNFTFQWSKDGVLIPAAVNQDYTTAVSGNYCVTVTSDCGGSAVDCYPLEIVDVPVLSLTTPAEICKQGVTKEIPVALNNPASLNHPIRYALIKGTQTLTSAIVSYNGDPYTFSISSPGDYTIYVRDEMAAYPANSCIATHSFSSIGVDVPNVYITAPPAGPVCQNAANIDLSGIVSIQGGTWTGTGISGSLFVPVNAVGANHLTYGYTNAGGCTSTAGVDITVNPVPMVISSPASVQPCEGTAATFTASAANAQAYQWQYTTSTVSGTWQDITDAINGISHTGANTATLSIPSAAVSINGLYYRCVIQGPCETRASGPAQLNIISPAGITTQPSDASVTESDPAVFSVAATGSGTFAYSWQVKAPGGNFSNLNAAGTSYAIPSATPFMQGNQYRVIITLNGCPVTSNAAALTVNINTWLGTASNDWNNAANWSIGIPTASLSAYIPSGTVYAPVMSSAASVKSLYIASGASLTINGSLEVYGDWVNNGTVIFSSGSNVDFEGTNLQVIKGTANTQFNNLNLNNSVSGVMLGSDQSLIATLQFGDAARFTTTGYSFTLISNAQGTASIGYMPDNAVWIGDANVQRYVNQGDPSGVINISTPISNATLKTLQSKIWMLGYTGTTAGFDAYGSWTVLRYDEIQNVWTIRGDDISTPLDNINAPLISGRGYRVRVPKDRNIIPSPTISPVTFEFKGAINRGLHDFHTTYSGSIVGASVGWNLIGNPYPCAIDWDSPTGWVKNNIQNTVSLWVQSSNMYYYYTNGIATPARPHPNLIALGQGFWVRSNDYVNSLSVNEHAKANISAISYRKAIPNNFVRIQMSHKTLFNEAVLGFREGATEGFDASHDVIRIDNPDSLGLSIISKENLALVMNMIAEPKAEPIYVPLSITSKYEGVHQIKFDNAGYINETIKLYLWDSQEQTIYPITNSLKYEFTLNPENSTEPRFWIIAGDGNSMRNRQALFNDVNIYPNPMAGDLLNIRYFGGNDEEVDVEVNNANGTTLRSKSYNSFKNRFNNFQLNCNDLPNGVYMVNVKSQGVSKVFKVIKI